MTREQIAQLLAKTKKVALAGKYELFKIVPLRLDRQASGLAGRGYA